MIELDALTFRYAGAKEPALRSLSLRVPRGGFLGILGPSRSGKTTLLSVLSGAVPHHRPGDFYGACRVGGLDTVEHTPTDLSRIVGSVFQDIDAQMVSSLVEDELLFALENFGVPQGELDGRIREALSAVGIEDLRHRSLDTLSGGQKQKVAIAAVLAMRPQVLALDEPTSRSSRSWPRTARRSACWIRGPSPCRAMCARCSPSRAGWRRWACACRASRRCTGAWPRRACRPGRCR